MFKLQPSYFCLHDNSLLRFQAFYLYLNGDLEASRTNVGNQNSSNGLSIGRDSYGGERFNGNIDEFAIWNSGLSAAEALAIYNGNAKIDLTGNSGDYASSSNLVLYLRMDEGFLGWLSLLNLL